MTVTDLSVLELRDLARAHDIAGRSRMNKAELCAALAPILEYRIPAPAGLNGSHGFWGAVVEDNELRPDELRILEDSCREMDLIDALETALGDSELLVSGSQGQPVANPLVQEIRQHRAVLARLLNQLHLPDDDEDTKKASRSASARELARARWGLGP